MRLTDIRDLAYSSDPKDIVLALNIVLHHKNEILAPGAISQSRKIFWAMVRGLGRRETKLLMKKYQNRPYAERIYILAKLTIDGQLDE